MSFDDHNSFLFGLNHLTSPQASGSNTLQMGGSDNRDGGSSSLLDGLDAFPGAGNADQQNNDIVEGGSFAEQLALWTNANFSFDGPTGHALLGDEEKEKAEKDKDDADASKDNAGNRRAGKRARNANDDDAAAAAAANNDALNAAAAARGLSNAVRSGKSRLRDENNVSDPSTPIEPASRRPNMEHQNSFNQLSRTNSLSEAKATPNGFPSHVNGNGVFGNGAVGSPFNGHTPHASPSMPQSAAAPQQGQFDLGQLVTLQQLLNQNPMALATLGNFNNLGGFGGQAAPGLNGQLLHQLQNQIQQQQQQLQQQQGNGQAPHFPQNAAFGGWGGFPNGVGAGAPYGGMTNGFGQNGSGAHGSSTTSNDDDNKSSGDDKNSKLTAEERAELHARRAEERDNIPPLKLIDTGNPIADAEANRVAIEEDKRRRNTAASARFRMKKKQREAALESHTKELEDQIAEQREELDKLRNENKWLKGLISVRTGDAPAESGFSTPANAKQGSNSAVEALQAAQQLQALQHAVSTQQAKQAQLQAHMQRDYSATSNDSIVNRSRDHGIRPRGVGTQREEAVVGSKRDRKN